MVALEIIVIQYTLDMHNQLHNIGLINSRWNEGLLWFISYFVGCFVVFITIKCFPYHRDTNLQFIKFATGSFMMNYYLCQVIRYSLAPLAFSLLGIDIEKYRKYVDIVVLPIAPSLPDFSSKFICTYHALKKTTRITTAGSSFVFIYLCRGIYLVFYGIALADLTVYGILLDFLCSQVWVE